jgi:probable F420-dependent oxidoreductase
MRNGGRPDPVAPDMTVELGRFGVWRTAAGLGPELAVEIERFGYGAIWIGGSPGADLALAESMLAGTERIAVATGVVNVWTAPPDAVAESYHRIESRYPGRFLLGVGIGHPEATREYRSPYATIVDYLDRLDAAEVPMMGRALAALGPKVLRVAAERTAGAHPYLTTPQHTRRARELVGPDVLLAPEHFVVLDEDPERARALGRPTVQRYLGLRNYTSNLRRLGFTDDDLAGAGSDRLVDALVAHGSAKSVADRLAAHLDAGADHVCAQVLGDGDPRPALRELAAALRF